VADAAAGSTAVANPAPHAGSVGAGSRPPDQEPSGLRVAVVARVRRCAAAAELGIEHMVVITSGPWTTDALATLAAAIPTLRQAGP